MFFSVITIVPLAIIYLNGQHLPSQKQMNKPDPAHKDNNEFDLG